MIELPSTRENLSMFFGDITRLYDNKAFPDFKGVYQFVLEEDGETYYFYLSVSEGKAEYAEGEHKSPSITIYTPVSVWFDIAIGKLNGTWGWLIRKYRIKGPIFYLKLFHKVFGKSFDNEMLGIEDKIQDFEIPKKRVWKKPDRILIISGSPRRKTGFTNVYLQYLIKGIEQEGVEVEVIDIYDKKFNIGHCQGCFTCWVKSKGKCVINDDVTSVVSHN